MDCSMLEKLSSGYVLLECCPSGEMIVDPTLYSTNACKV